MLVRIRAMRYIEGPYRIRATYVRNELIRPAVYLDHWALMRFSEDAELRRRFIDALRTSGGTLCLSHVNTAEFCRAADPRHADAVDRLIEQVMPQVFFLQADKNLKRSGGDDFQVVGDINLAEHVARPHPPGEPGYFRTYWNVSATVTPTDGQNLNEIFDQATRKMATAFNDVRQDPEFLAKARRFDPAKGHSPMWTLLGELMRPPMLNPQEELDANDASDVQHALNALYCDYILLDRGWTSKLNQARPRLQKAGISVARCYSPKQRDIERFLCDLKENLVLASAASHDHAD